MAKAMVVAADMQLFRDDANVLSTKKRVYTKYGFFLYTIHFVSKLKIYYEDND